MAYLWWLLAVLCQVCVCRTKVSAVRKLCFFNCLRSVWQTNKNRAKVLVRNITWTSYTSSPHTQNTSHWNCGWRLKNHTNESSATQNTYQPAGNEWTICWWVTPEINKLLWKTIFHDMSWKCFTIRASLKRKSYVHWNARGLLIWKWASKHRGSVNNVTQRV